MRRTGLIKGWTLGVNPTLFGYCTAFVWADVNPPATKEKVIRTTSRNPHAFVLQDFFDGSVGISLAYANREELKTEISAIREGSNSRNLRTSETPPLPCRVKLAETDWSIVKSLRRDPRKPYQKVADELGLSRRAVERRARRMIDAGALFVLPELDLRRLEGGVLASLDVFYWPEHKQGIDRKVQERYGELVLITHSTSPEFGWYALVVPNVAVAHEIQSWAGNLQGVRMTDLRLIENYINLVGKAFEQELQTAPRIPVTCH